MHPGQFLDDERDTFGLGMDRGGGRSVDRSAQNLAQQLGGFDRGESADPDAADDTHPLEIGDEVHRLRDLGELLRPNRQEQEDRPIGIAPDDIAEEAKRVVVGPLDVIQEERQGPGIGERRDGDPTQVERPKELRIGGQRFVPGLVPAGDRIDDALNGGLGAPVAGDVPDGGVREQAPRQQERAADLLICGHCDDGEPGLLGTIGGSEEQPRLPDPWLALDTNGGQSRGRVTDLAPDRLQLGGSSNDVAGSPAEVDRQRTLRLDEGIERTAVDRTESSGDRCGPNLAEHDPIIARDDEAGRRVEIAPYVIDIDRDRQARAVAEAIIPMAGA
jgi:hypothetical protein